MVASTDEADLTVGGDGMRRCWWCGGEPDYVAYHDHEWGRPEFDGVRLFEKLSLEAFQAGLSWLTVLRRREALHAALAGFDPVRLARFTETDIDRVVADPRVIRHRGKVDAVVANARTFLELGGTEAFSARIWRHAPTDLPVAPRNRDEVPVTTPEARALARDLKDAGWRFIGPTSAYAFMQSMGLVNDHLAGCDLRDGVSAGGQASSG